MNVAPTGGWSLTHPKATHFPTQAHKWRPYWVEPDSFILLAVIFLRRREPGEAHACVIVASESHAMRYIEALETYTGNGTSLFLAGGIMGCPDWQREMVEALRGTTLVVLNPRRVHYQFNEEAAR